MKPQTPHWADIAAARIVGAQPKKNKYILASGITPSGIVHVGNFREAVTVDLVSRALSSLGKEVVFLYSWDDFDTFRKVPAYLPDRHEYKKFLRQPIARIPDPWHREVSYSLGRIRAFERELAMVGIYPEYRYQEALYTQGKYAESIRTALENRSKIRSILDKYRTQPLEEHWVPTSIYCGRCSKDDILFQNYEGEWLYHYKCRSCGFEETVDIRTTKNLKLNWRVDWPMRWAYEGVDFEPGGKDHSGEGGSYETAKEIVREVWNTEPPIYLQFDFVGIKGGNGKMSSSGGNLYTLGQVLEVYEPDMVRWIFANQRPNHDFSISFDEDVFKVYDEFDRNEAMAYDPDILTKKKGALIKRTYELALVNRTFLRKAPVRVGFRDLCNRLQICGYNPQRTFVRYYSDSVVEAADKAAFFMRAERAISWLKQHAPADFCYTLRDSRVSLPLSNLQENALAGLRELLLEVELEKISNKELNDLIWERLIHSSGCEAKQAFSAVYQKLIGRDQGPRLPGFLREIGADKVLELL